MSEPTQGRGCVATAHRVTAGGQGLSCLVQGQRARNTRVSPSLHPSAKVIHPPWLCTLVSFFGLCQSAGIILQKYFMLWSAGLRRSCLPLALLVLLCPLSPVTSNQCAAVMKAGWRCLRLHWLSRDRGLDNLPRARSLLLSSTGLTKGSLQKEVSQRFMNWNITFSSSSFFFKYLLLIPASCATWIFAKPFLINFVGYRQSWEVITHFSMQWNSFHGLMDLVTYFRLGKSLDLLNFFSPFFLLYPVFRDTMAKFLLFIKAAWWYVALQLAKLG